MSKLYSATELADELGFGDAKVYAMKKAGMPFRYAGKTTLNEAMGWMESNPNFKTTAIYKKKFYDRKQLAEGLATPVDTIDKMRELGLQFSHGSLTVFQPVKEFLMAHPEFAELLENWKKNVHRGRPSRHSKKDEALHV